MVTAPFIKDSEKETEIYKHYWGIKMGKEFWELFS